MGYGKSIIAKVEWTTCQLAREMHSPESRRCQATAVASVLHWLYPVEAIQVLHRNFYCSQQLQIGT